MQDNLVQELMQILTENKVKNIEKLNISTKSPLISELIVGTFPNDKYKTVAKQIKTAFEDLLKKEVYMEGEFPGDWVVYDLDNVVVELFSEDKRAYYNLEKLWGNSHLALPKTKNKKKN